MLLKYVQWNPSYLPKSATAIHNIVSQLHRLLVLCTAVASYITHYEPVGLNASKEINIGAGVNSQIVSWRKLIWTTKTHVLKVTTGTITIITVILLNYIVNLKYYPDLVPRRLALNKIIVAKHNN